jgi:hypothetical protein
MRGVPEARSGIDLLLCPLKCPERIVKRILAHTVMGWAVAKGSCIRVFFSRCELFKLVKGYGTPELSGRDSVRGNPAFVGNYYI